MQQYTPNSIWGWLGIIIVIGAIVYHKSLTWLGLILALVLGWYLYAQVDAAQAPAGAASSGS